VDDLLQERSRADDHHPQVGDVVDGDPGRLQEVAVILVPDQVSDVADDECAARNAEPIAQVTLGL